MGSSGVVLGATLHDPVGRLAGAIERLAGPLREVFPAIALNISDATTPEVIAAARLLGDRVMIHAAGEAIIGKARRDAVALAADGRPVLYADFDHMLRWVEFGPEDLRAVLATTPDVDCLVVGRSERALAAEPRRLRETEALVNHAHALLTGKHWDLMFAIRRLSPAAARLIVERSEVDSLANDVEWPLLVRQAGLRTGYAQSDALFYRTIEEFGAAADSGDDDPLQWIRRLEFAALHASAMRRFL
ncbi:hypothetical protein [Devosia elaeis]|jgi:hypothetical protein|uniref:Glycosyltransferase 2-like domain-containing protein n=1 Tax=Devosia elaeis TaxID=1770058 RepID=A0A178HV50_9HYPH|nr:hypothetical protein [Devosia elaeis]OAM76713.1 hypothetical protein A3840_12240 [Devosia elaeis]